jgi:leucyl aminopeptidase
MKDLIMNFELVSMTVSDAAVCKGDVLVVLVPKAFKPGKGVVPDLIVAALKSGDLETKAGKLLPLYQVPGVSCKRLILVGCDEGKPRQVRQAVAAAVAAVKSTNCRKIVVCLAASADVDAVRMAVMASAEASYVYTTTKSKPEPRVLSLVTVCVPDAAPLRSAFDRVVAAVKGVEFAKEWANRPGNYATPTMLADAAKSLAKAPLVQCEVLGPKQVAKLGMGAFMAVAMGSHEELRFIVLRYNGGPKGEAPMVLVGKGISFDSGGISIKPAPEMDEMKYDMCGAASVLGVFRALGELKLPMNVVGLIPSCENLPDGKAVKPGDVVTSMSGQTIEILNTDAEGRLVLCDALTYAERLEPRAVVDIATLTGACVIALGGVRSALFASTDALADSLLAAGESAQDPCWRMPLDDEYAEGLKTNFADVANVAGRPAGAITAAKFLQRFTEKYPWAHLDIAGIAWKGGAAKGATGRPVPLLLEFLWASAGQGQVAAPKAPARARRKA